MKAKFLLPLLAASCSLLLSNCVPLAVVAGASVTGSVVYDQRSVKQQLKDTNTSNRLSNQLNDDKTLLNNSNISFTVFNNQALLVGQVKTPELRQQAEAIAQHTKGVAKVFNELTISNNQGLLTSTKDSWITTKVKANMLANKALNSSAIKVVTENSVVYLLGNLTGTQASLAITVAKSVDGVTRVVSLLGGKTNSDAKATKRALPTPQ